MKYARWIGGQYDEAAAGQLREAGYPYLLALVLAARGVSSPETAAELLDRDRKLTLSPMLMRDMDKAVARIQRAISDGETIAWRAGDAPRRRGAGHHRQGRRL